MHQVERIVDARDRQRVGDEIVDVDLSLHVPVDDSGNIGTPSRAAERRSFPAAAGHQLKRSRLDLLTCAGHADDDGDAPAAVTAFERLAHNVDIADAFETVVGAAARQLDEMLNEIGADRLRIDEM